MRIATKAVETSAPQLAQVDVFSSFPPSAATTSARKSSALSAAIEHGPQMTKITPRGLFEVETGHLTVVCRFRRSRRALGEVSAILRGKIRSGRA
jgi:hypothetical protein